MEPGFYWVKSIDDGELQIVAVKKLYETIYATFTGDDRYYTIHEMLEQNTIIAKIEPPCPK